MQHQSLTNDMSQCSFKIVQSR